MRFLALDVGQRRIGLAVGDDRLGIASPLRTLERRGGADSPVSAELLDDIGAVIEEVEAEALVVGLPLDLSGNEGPATQRARRLARQLEQRLALPVHFWDERFSSAEVERLLISAGVSRARRKQVVDPMAAAVILQSFLDHRARRGEVQD